MWTDDRSPRMDEDGYAALYADGRALALEDAPALALHPD